MMVLIYGMKNCGWCDKAVALCKKHGRDTAYFDVHEGRNIDIFKELFPGAKMVPQVIIDGEHIGGYTELEKYLTQ